MDTLSYRTISANKQTVKKEWLLIDAENQTVGRLASKIAMVLRGKHKPNFTPHVDCGDNIVVINADKIKFTGNKMSYKKYLRHTGYPGGQREATAEMLLKKKPTEILHHAVKGMLPKNKLGNKVIKKLHLFIGAEHDKQAQNPQEFNIDTIK